MTHSNVPIKGFNGSITTLGELHCNINIGNCDSPIFEDINVLVTTQDTPILIGQNILAHNTLDSYIIETKTQQLNSEAHLHQVTQYTQPK